jgi:hypothetical protein
MKTVTFNPQLATAFFSFLLLFSTGILDSVASAASPKKTKAKPVLMTVEKKLKITFPAVLENEQPCKKVGSSKISQTFSPFLECEVSLTTYIKYLPKAVKRAAVIEDLKDDKSYEDPPSEIIYKKHKWGSEYTYSTSTEGSAKFHYLVFKDMKRTVVLKTTPWFQTDFKKLKIQKLQPTDH